MSNKITDKPTSNATPTNWFVNIGGELKQFTTAAFNALIGTLLGTQTHAATGKTTPVDGDELPISDSEAANATKRVSLANLWTWAKAKSDALYAAISHTHSAADLTSGTLPDARFPSTLPALNGSLLTNLNAAALSSGTIDPARIPLLYSGIQVVSSGAISDLTSPQQTAISAGAIVTTTDGRRWAYSGSGSKTSEASYIILADVTPDWSVIASKPSSFTPDTHAASHKSGGADAIKLDELAAPTDVTTLNATTSAHGLLPKLGGGTTNFLRADGTWAAPPGGGGGGGSATWTDQAWIEPTDGNDGTGAVEDITKPYATIQAAYDAGARIFHVGKGNAGNLVLATGGTNILLIGLGSETSSVGTISAVPTVSATYYIRGNGICGITIGSIFIAPGATPDGVAGWNSGALYVKGFTCSGHIQMYSANGGKGGDGADTSDFTPPGNGASGQVGGAGPSIYAEDVIGTGVCGSYAGNGGGGGNGGNSTDNSSNGGDGGPGGTGGSGGGVDAKRCSFSTLVANYGNGGAAGNGGSGYSAGASGINGDGGGFGSLYTRWCDITNPAGASETTTFRLSAINDYWNS